MVGMAAKNQSSVAMWGDLLFLMFLFMYILCYFIFSQTKLLLGNEHHNFYSKRFGN